MARPHLTTPDFNHTKRLSSLRMIKVEFGLIRFRSPLLAKFLLVYIPPGTEMFYFPGYALYYQVIKFRLKVGEFPHSETSGSKVA